MTYKKAGQFAMGVIYMLLALGCLALALYSVWLDRAASAAVAATFTCLHG